MSARPRLARYERWLSALLAIVAMVYLPFAVWTARLVLLHPWDGIEWTLATGVVQSIYRGGPADGLLEPGDQIVAVDGVVPRLALPLYAERQVGQEVQFTVRRDGFQSPVALQLATPPVDVRILALLPLLTALGVWFLGGVVLVLSVQPRLRTLFFLFCLDAAVSLSAGAVSSIGPRWTSSLFNLGLWVFLPLAIHLHLYFPDRLRFPGQRLLVAGLYGLAGLAAIVYLAWTPAVLREFAWYPQFHTGARLALAGGFLGAVALMTWGYFRDPSPSYRRGARLVLLSAGVAFIPFVFLGILAEVLLGRTLLPYSTLFPLFLAIPVGYGGAILRHRLLRLERVVNRTTAHVIASLLTMTWVVLLSSVVRARWEPDLLASALLDLGIVIAVAWLFGPTLGQVQTLVDWAFYGGWYHHQDVVQQVGDELDRVVDPAAFEPALCSKLCATMRLRCACLVLTEWTLLDLPTPEPSDATVCQLFALPARSAPKLPVAGKLSRYFDRVRGSVQADRLRDELGDQVAGLEHQIVACDHVRLWVPFWERDILLGLVGIGARYGADGFGAADRQTLGIIANHVATSIRNLELNAQLSSRISEVNALNRRLVLLREEERRELARDLHDDVIQGLVSLQFQIAHSEQASPLPLYESIGGLVDRLRALCRGLRPPVLDSLGLVPALRSHVRELARGSPIEIDLQIEGDQERELPEQVSLTLFRALQEALVNIQKHARASRVEVRLVIRQDALHLTVQDDGRGFAVPPSLGTFLTRDSFGLVGLRERLELVGGTLRVRSQPGQGTELRIRVPLAAEWDGAANERWIDDRVSGDGTDVTREWVAH
jgi:signal transduction histidine kinase